jgi:putative membrane protein
MDFLHIQKEANMYKILIPVAAAGALLAACGEQDPVSATQDAASVPVGQTSAMTLGANTVDGYVTNAAMGDMYEIRAAEMALERSQNAEVRALAQMILNDHTAAGEALQGIVQSQQIDVQMPTELDERRQGLLDNLRDADNFDEVFIDQQVAAHQEALTLHKGFADNEDAPELAAHASNAVPKLEAHLEQARALDN